MYKTYKMRRYSVRDLILGWSQFNIQQRKWHENFDRIHKKNNESRGKPMFSDKEASDEFVYG